MSYYDEINRNHTQTSSRNSGMETHSWILFMWASLSEAFNIDTEHPLRFNGAAEDFFSYSVYQSEFENRKQIIVGAPLKRNSTGEIYSCTVDLLSCSPLHWPGSESVRFFGMSTAVSSAAVGRLTSCSPYLPHECDGNSYLNGICYQFNSGLQAVSNFTVAYQECTKREVNLVFLFDGSSSMKAQEFEKNKHFIKDVMKKLSNSSIKFAAVQFSATFRTVFDFNDYQNGFAEDKLMKETHMKSLTRTLKAINYTLTNLLNNVSSGADLKAQKALVIITDGDHTDPDSENIILDRCDEENILRYCHRHARFQHHPITAHSIPGVLIINSYVIGHAQVQIFDSSSVRNPPSAQKRNPPARAKVNACMSFQRPCEVHVISLV